MVPLFLCSFLCRSALPVGKNVVHSVLLLWITSCFPEVRFRSTQTGLVSSKMAPALSQHVVFSGVHGRASLHPSSSASSSLCLSRKQPASVRSRRESRCVQAAATASGSSSLEPPDVPKLARMASLHLDDGDVPAYQAQVEKAIGFLGELLAVDVDGVVPTTAVSFDDASRQMGEGVVDKTQGVLSISRDDADVRDTQGHQDITRRCLDSFPEKNQTTNELKVPFVQKK